MIISYHIFTRRNEVLAKVIFLHLSVIHSVHRGEYLTRPDTPPRTRQVPPGTRHPPDQTPPPGPGRYPLGPDTPPDQTPPQDQAGTPWDQTPPGPDTPGTKHPPTPRPDTPQDQTPPPLPRNSRLRNTVNDRPVRILLECILVIAGYMHLLALVSVLLYAGPKLNTHSNRWNLSRQNWFCPNTPSCIQNLIRDQQPFTSVAEKGWNNCMFSNPRWHFKDLWMQVGWHQNFKTILSK